MGIGKGKNVRKGTKGFVSTDPGKTNVPQAGYYVNWEKVGKNKLVGSVDNETILNDYELAAIPVPERANITSGNWHALSVEKGKLIPGNPVAAKDINRSTRDIIIAQYADVREVSFAAAVAKSKLPDSDEEISSIGYDAFFSEKVKKKVLQESLTLIERTYLESLLKVDKDYPLPWFKKSSVCKSCGLRDANIDKHYCALCIPVNGVNPYPLYLRIDK